MKKSLRTFALPGICAAIAAAIAGCGKPPSVTLTPAPPGPGELGPAIECGTTPADAIVFDLKYLAETGSAGDIRYFSFWGYGGSRAESKTNSFLQDVRKRASRICEVYCDAFPGRAWAAVEYSGRQALMMYFDLNADGKLSDNERIPPTRKEREETDFITPDFMQRQSGGGEMLCRTVLQVNFYGEPEPNCYWSPAAVLEGTAQIGGRPARVLLYQNNPGGAFDRYGSSSYSLILGEKKSEPGSYMPRERLSSLIPAEGGFYHLTVDGRRTNGLPARVLLVKDTSPTGELAVKLAATNSVQARLTGLSLNGVDDKTVFFRVDGAKEKMVLPVGTYALASGEASYGTTKAEDWALSFRDGPKAEVKAGTAVEVTLGQPVLKVRAIEENRRYSSDAVEQTKFKKGTRVYLEPKIAGKGNEIFSRFRQQSTSKGQMDDCEPHVTITGPDGKQVLSKTMEYG